MRSGGASSSPWTVPIVVALIGAVATVLVAVINNFNGLDRVRGVDDPPGRSAPALNPQQPEASEPSTGPQAGVPTGSSDGPQQVVPGSTACVVTVRNTVLSLRREPKPFSQELIRVKPGTYPSLRYAESTLPGGQKQGWFQITVEARTGWVEDNIISIDSKTSACP